MPTRTGTAPASPQPAPASSARRSSRRVRARRTCSWTGPSRRRRSRSAARCRTRPTRVGLPSCPHGPAPMAAASRRRMRSGATPARPSGGTLQGSHSRSAQEITAGSSTSRATEPSSVSQRTRSRRCSSPSSRTAASRGRSRSSASSAGTWAVSASTELRPQTTTSTPPRARTAAARARAVARVSLPAKAGSVTRTPSSAPQAIASRRLSSAEGGPRVRTVQRPPPEARATPAVTARRQYGFISSSRPSRTSRPSGPSAIASKRGTCLTTTTTRSPAEGMVFPSRPTAATIAGAPQAARRSRRIATAPRSDATAASRPRPQSSRALCPLVSAAAVTVKSVEKGLAVWWVWSRRLFTSW